MGAYNYDNKDKLFAYESVRKMQILVKTSLDAFERMYPLFSFSIFPPRRERFYALCLDEAGKQISKLRCSFEAEPYIMVDISQVLDECSKSGARRLVIAHSSISNDTRPTEQDHILTGVLKEECLIEGIILQDHLIISEYGIYFSFADEGYL